MKKRNPQLNKNGELIHLLSTEGLPREILTQHGLADTGLLRRAVQAPALLVAQGTQGGRQVLIGFFCFRCFRFFHSYS